MKVFLIIFTICLLALLAWVVAKMAELDEREEELDKYSVHLDERANMLAEWERELKADRSGYVEFKAVYYLSEADGRFANDSRVKVHVRNHLSSTIAFDIVRTFDPELSEDGRSYSLTVKARK